MTEVTGPNRPEPKNVSLDAAKTAVVVLDLNARCHEPEEVCHRLMEPLGGFLERVREASVPVVFTISLQFRGTPLGEAAAPLKRRDTEPGLCPVTSSVPATCGCRSPRASPRSPSQSSDARRCEPRSPIRAPPRSGIPPRKREQRLTVTGKANGGLEGTCLRRFH